MTRIQRDGLFTIAACAALFFGCRAEEDSQKLVPGNSRPNVLLISIDSLRADRLGCYGAGPEVSPHIDRLAAEGSRFTDSLSSSSWTLPAHAALFTGLPDSGHGCDSNEALLSPSHETLAEHLQVAGYETIGFWSGPYLHPIFGLAQGFERYVSCTGFEVFGAKSLTDARTGDSMRGEARANARSHRDVTGPRVLEAFDSFLDGRVADRAGARAKPFFAFVHLWDVHYDYIAPKEWRDRFADPTYEGPMDGSARAVFEATRGSRPGSVAPGISERDLDQLRALYDAEIAWTDHHIGAIRAKLKATGLLDDTLIVLTADHGEEFFEHGRFGHRKQLFLESVQVPLIVRLPGAESPQRTFDLPIGGSDVAPTILELAGLKVPGEMTGNSVAPLLQSSSKQRPSNLGHRPPVFSELVQLGGRGRLAMARDATWSVLFDPEKDLALGVWNRSEDRRETRDLSGENGAAAASAFTDSGRLLLQRIRDSHRPAESRGEALPEELENQLRALGYISD